jgi:hypothetical protein
MHNHIEVFIIGGLAFVIAGAIMRFCYDTMGIWFGRKGGFFLWLVTALLLTYVYALFK